MCLTVDTIVAGNRERDHRTGFTTPPKLTLESLFSFATHPEWSLRYLMGPKFKLANISHLTKKDRVLKYQLWIILILNLI